MKQELISYPIFFLSILAITFVNRKAVIRLTSEQKKMLMDYGTGVAMWRLIPVIILAVGFAGYMLLKPTFLSNQASVTFYLITVFLLSLASNIWIVSKYKRLGFPSHFIRVTAITTTLSLLLIAFLFVMTLFPFGK